MTTPTTRRRRKPPKLTPEENSADVLGEILRRAAEAARKGGDALLAGWLQELLDRGERCSSDDVKCPKAGQPAGELADR